MGESYKGWVGDMGDGVRMSHGRRIFDVVTQRSVLSSRACADVFRGARRLHVLSQKSVWLNTHTCDNMFSVVNPGEGYVGVFVTVPSQSL